MCSILDAKLKTRVGPNLKLLKAFLPHSDKLCVCMCEPSPNK